MEQVPRPRKLKRDHPCAAAFLDETGSISGDRFFGVGLIKVEEPSRLLRAVQLHRDRTHWYKEYKFTDITKGTLGLYKDVVDVAMSEACGINFFCFMADRDVADPIARFGSQWEAYAKLAEQLVVASIKPTELISIMADNYSTPHSILFEENLRETINRRLRRLAVTTVCRLDSKSSNGLQIVDLLTSATAFEFRADAGLTSSAPGQAKSEFSQYVRSSLGAKTCLTGWRNDQHSVQIYDHGRWTESPDRPLLDKQT